MYLILGLKRLILVWFAGGGIYSQGVLIQVREEVGGGVAHLLFPKSWQDGHLSFLFITLIIIFV